MKILITGASGFLGQHFLHSLLQNTANNSNDIHAIYRSMEGFEEAVRSHHKHSANEIANSKNANTTLQFHQLDLTNKNEIDEYFESQKSPFDICFHLAALSSPRACHADPESAKLINCPSHFLEKLKDTPVVALSTDQVYDGKSADLYNESDAPPRSGAVNVYSQTKLDLEASLLSNGNGNGNGYKRNKPAICLRSSIILGPNAPFGKAHSTFLHFCQSRKDQETTFYTDEIRSVIHVEDVVHVLLHFCNSNSNTNTCTDMQSGVYNMGGPAPVSRMDMAIAVAKQCGFQHEGSFIPAVKGAGAGAGAGAGVVATELVSPLDISMSSSRLEDLVGKKFKSLEEIVQHTFS